MKLVIKLGSSTLTHEGGGINIRRFHKLCQVVADLMNAGNQVVLVSSGAIAMGVAKLGLTKRPEDMPTKQAVAAVGQCVLMDSYDRTFGEFGRTVAQILLTGADVENSVRLENFNNTVNRLLEMGVLPIINENDTVETEEITVGDNDTLSAIVASAIKADLLVLLSDIDGLYSGDPRKDENAKLIPEVYELTPEILSVAGGAGTGRGTGGMQTKLSAAKIVTNAGCDMIIAQGSNPDILYDIVEGQAIGTRFYAGKAGK
ncbi:MAG: glutamate 5-kinase [Clostridia bacterium]|nr:glutamate 5-kinase [Clostridia bacterium]